MEAKDPNITFPPPNPTPMEELPKSAYPPLRFMSKRLILIFLGITAIVFVAGIFVAGRNLSTNENAQNTTVSPTPTPTSVDETTNWKTYTNTQYGYSIKYPEDMKIDDSNRGAVGFYRNTVSKPGTGGQGRCCGMSVYYRDNEAIDIESQAIENGRPVNVITVAGYQAKEIGDNPKYLQDLWIKNPYKDRGVRITISTINAQNPYDKEDFEIFQKMLSTFKFTDQANPSPSASPEQTACTQEAKLCPDGSYVSREGPNCDFSPCP